MKAANKKHKEAFGRVLRKIRVRRNLTQDELALEANIDRTHISQLELGEKSPTLTSIVNLCAALDVRLDDFMVDVFAEMGCKYD